jgi:hypothetical protein
MSQHRTS